MNEKGSGEMQKADLVALLVAIKAYAAEHGEEKTAAFVLEMLKAITG